MDTSHDPEKLDDLVDLFGDSDYCTNNPYVFDEYFCDQAEHRYLKQVWDRRPPLKGLRADAFPDLQLVDVMHETDYFVVCRGIAPDGTVVCVKFPKYRSEDKHYWNAADAAILNEVAVLRELLPIRTVNPNFPALRSSGQIPWIEERPAPYLVTEYISGLRAFVNVRFESVRELLTAFTRICRAVDSLHKHKLVHCDLPGNVFLDCTGQPIIIDFATTARRRWRGEADTRTFGPRITEPIEEARYPSRTPTPAFDVYCLAIMLQRKLSEFDQLDESTGERLVYPHVNKLERLLSYCKIAHPEYRLRTAGKLADAIETIVRGEDFEWSPSLVDHATYYMRRYPIQVTASAALFVMILVVSLGSFLYGLSLTAGVREVQRAYRDGNESRLKLVRISVEQERESPSVRYRDVRKQLFLELQNVLLSSRIPEDMLLSTLDLCLELALAHEEIDGYEDAVDVAQTCLDILNQRNLNAPSYQLRRIKFQVIAAHGYFELKIAPDSKLKAQQFAESAANEFLSLSSHWSEPDSAWSGEELLTTGYLVARNGLYPQRREEWLASQNGRLAWAIFERLDALSAAPNLSLEGQLYHCRIQTTRGRAIYKSMFVGLLDAAHLIQLAERDLSEALARLESLLKTTDDPNLRAKISAEIARTQIALAQVFDAHEHYEPAIKLGKAAIEFYEAELIRLPGSLRAVRETISAMWIYSDIFFDRPARGWPLDQELEQFRDATKKREELLELCEFQIARDRSSESMEAYAVNAIRTAIAYIQLNEEDNAERVLRKMESITGLLQPNSQLHGPGEQFLVCLLFLAKRSTDAAPYEDKIQQMLGKVRDAHQATQEKPTYYRFLLQLYSRDSLRPTRTSEKYLAWIQLLENFAR